MFSNRQIKESFLKREMCCCQWQTAMRSNLSVSGGNPFIKFSSSQSVPANIIKNIPVIDL
jgi:hypothetical protein